MTVIVKLFVV